MLTIFIDDLKRMVCGAAVNNNILQIGVVLADDGLDTLPDGILSIINYCNQGELQNVQMGKELPIYIPANYVFLKSIPNYIVI